MKRSLRNFAKLCAGAVTSLFLLGGCATIGAPEAEPLTLEKIVEMSKAGKDAQAIIGDIKASRNIYDVQASQYAKLSRDGVPDAVLDFMQVGQLKMAERMGQREAYNDAWLFGRGIGYGGIWSPRPYVVYINGRAYLRNW